MFFSFLESTLTFFKENLLEVKPIITIFKVVIYGRIQCTIVTRLMELLKDG